MKEAIKTSRYAQLGSNMMNHGPFMTPAFTYHAPPPQRKQNALTGMPEKLLSHILEYLSPFPYFGITAQVCKMWFRLTERRWGETDTIYFHNVEGKTNAKAPIVRVCQKQEQMASNVFKEVKLQHQMQMNQLHMQIQLQQQQLHTLQGTQFLNVGDLDTVRQHQINVQTQIIQLQHSLQQVRGFLLFSHQVTSTVCASKK